MKICVIGFSASGKTTFSNRLSQKLGIKVMHLDTYNFLDNWEVRDRLEFTQIVEKFIDAEDYIVEGNYNQIAPKRFEEADIVFYFCFNRFKCLYGQLNRYFKYRNKVRDEYITDCKERINWEFLKWIFYKGRSRQKKRKHLSIAKGAKEYYIFKKRKQVNKYLESIGINVK